MNKTNTPTVNKKMFTLRLTPETYRKIRENVNKIKEKDGYNYSINDYLTELIEKGLKG